MEKEKGEGEGKGGRPKMREREDKRETGERGGKKGESRGMT